MYPYAAEISTKTAFHKGLGTVRKRLSSTFCTFQSLMKCIAYCSTDASFCPYFFLFLFFFFRLSLYKRFSLSGLLFFFFRLSLYKRFSLSGLLFFFFRLSLDKRFSLSGLLFFFFRL